MHEQKLALDRRMESRNAKKEKASLWMLIKPAGADADHNDHTQLWANHEAVGFQLPLRQWLRELTQAL